MASFYTIKMMPFFMCYFLSLPQLPGEDACGRENKFRSFPEETFVHGMVAEPLSERILCVTAVHHMSRLGRMPAAAATFFCPEPKSFTFGINTSSGTMKTLIQGKEGPLKLIIVDDEKDACNDIQDILLNEITLPLAIVGVAHNTAEAEKLIALSRPDALLMDIEMPGESAFQFLKRLPGFSFDVVFITAYDDYAVKAFQLHAVDYLLKPIDPADLNTAVCRLNERRAYRHLLREHGQQFSDLFGQLDSKKQADKIFLKAKDTIEVVAFNDVVYLEAMGSYAKIFFKKGSVIKEIVVSNPVATYNDILPADIFYRIHKSFLVNCTFIEEISGGERPGVLLKGGISLPIGKRRFSATMAFLKTHSFS